MKLLDETRLVTTRMNMALVNWIESKTTRRLNRTNIIEDALIHYIKSQESDSVKASSSNVIVKYEPTSAATKKKATAKKVKVLAERPESIPVQIWAEYLALRKTKKAILTKTAFATIIEQGRIAGLDELETVKTCLSNGWAGFKASWVNKDKGIINYGTDQRDCKQDQGTRRNGETESQYRDRLSRQISEEFAEIVRADPSERSTPEQF